MRLALTHDPHPLSPFSRTLLSPYAGRMRQARRLKGELERARDIIEAHEQKITQLMGEVSSRGDQLIELGQLRINAEADTSIKGNMSSELENLKMKLHESNQQLTVLAVADGREGGAEGERVLPLLLLELLRLQPQKLVLAEQTMIAMQYVLSSDRHADAELVRIRDGVDLILDVMRRHESAADLQSAACGLLWKVAFADPDVRTSIVEAGGVAQIMGSMQRHAGHPRLHYNACGALRHLLVTAPRQFSVVSQLTPGHASPNAALPPITAGSAAGRRTAPGRRRGQLTNIPVGAPPRMLLAGGAGARSGLRGVSSDPHLRHSGVGVLSPNARPATVSALPRRQEAVLETKPAAKEEVSLQAMRLTLRSMADHAETPLVQEYGCGTLYNLVLANPEAMRACILRDGGVPLILQAMRLHPTAAGTQLSACALIKELAEYQPCLQQLDEGGARKLLVSVMQHHQFNAELSARAAERP